MPTNAAILKSNLCMSMPGSSRAMSDRISTDRGKSMMFANEVNEVLQSTSPNDST